MSEIKFLEEKKVKELAVQIVNLVDREKYSQPEFIAALKLIIQVMKSDHVMIFNREEA